jgi:hypothetical protein
MFDNIIWLAIGFILTYGAMELAWRMAKGMIMISKRNTVAEDQASSSIAVERRK